ncbi:conserved hypothetical protein [Teredinibacter turnerae T7901]|uniref:Uncharacterized protein n=1 Tax=Teredinibacter turnerae (strain ATCC 39867 / T7901) TaxID=377629 RepID=C5BJ69_TERTT|nr:hypothetical protein [Teredinibacter turnerae]ACR12123.1 conserved hypothetical protein [Teredinibacter turnerae T7901]
MYQKYFEDWQVKPDYSKEYVSLWDGWLGKENYHKLDEVTEEEWGRFNILLKNLAGNFCIESADCEKETLTGITNIETVLSTYKDSMNKESSEFLKLVFPGLDCVISEEWDYTYIIWHKNNGAVEKLIPYIKAVGLEHFHD